MRRRFSLAVILAALFPSPSAAIVSNPLPRICNEFPRSDYVFSGKVISEGFSENEYGRGEGARTYRLRVDHVFKGKMPRLVRVITPADSGGGALDAGQPAIVFARDYKGRIDFSGSSNSQSGAATAKIIAQIRSYIAHPPEVATIAGRVDGRDPEPKGIRLLLMDGKSTKFVRTDSRGTLLASVHPGDWSIRIAESGWASRRGVYSYDNTEHMRLAKGGCADFELETLPPKVKPFGLPRWERWPEASHARR
nr:hypothetical protein [Sphingomonas sp.]